MPCSMFIRDAKYLFMQIAVVCFPYLLYVTFKKKLTICDKGTSWEGAAAFIWIGPEVSALTGELLQRSIPMFKFGLALEIAAISVVETESFPAGLFAALRVSAATSCIIAAWDGSPERYQPSGTYPPKQEATALYLCRSRRYESCEPTLPICTGGLSPLCRR